MVARTVSRREVQNVPDANAACQKEWDRLKDIGCWDVSGVQEWSKVKREAASNDQQIHIGSLHELCMEKGGSELPSGHPGRKNTGRVVFLGDRVKDQNDRVVVFE